MSTNLRTAAQQALEALEVAQDHWYTYHGGLQSGKIDEAIKALKAALEQPELCSCGDRAKDQCPGEWDPGCDLGNNPKYARREPLNGLNGELLVALQRSRAQWIHSVNAEFCLAAIARAEGKV